jgi:hypothetical protein
MRGDDMKSTAAARADALPLIRVRFSDYLELIRPRIAALVLFTAAAGFCLASAGSLDLARLLHTLVGLTLVTCSRSSSSGKFLIFWPLPGFIATTTPAPGFACCLCWTQLGAGRPAAWWATAWRYSR